MTDLDPETLIKWKFLIAKLKTYDRIGVSLSGGVDSALVCAAAVESVGRERVTAFFIQSSMELPEALIDARLISEMLGVQMVIITMDELENELVRNNPPDRCYHCKAERMKKIKALASTTGNDQLMDGSNADDLNDYRPGRKALLETGVMSPLAVTGITKNEVRRLAKWLGLPIWNKPSTPCLASRFPYGTLITHQRIEQIRCVEEVLRNMGFLDMRVRYHESMAKIEVPQDRFADIIKNREIIIAAIKKCGFNFVTLDLQGFRSGSLNEVLV